MSERELSQKIKDFLNKNSEDFKFKLIDSFCDIADERQKIYIEVKIDHFAPAQLLHAIAREEIKNAKYLGVADNKVVKLFLPPDFEKIYAFATSFDPKLVFAPSHFDKPDLNKQAFNILGKPEREIKLEFPDESFSNITKENFETNRRLENMQFETAYAILHQMGFERISYFAKPFDLQAEKDGKVYDIMLETGNNGNIEVAWQKLKELISACIKWKNHKALLILMNYSGDASGACVFEMLHGSNERDYYRPWFNA